MRQASKAAGVAWLVTALYYFYQYTLRSAPAVMMPQLSEAFGLSAMGVASLAGLVCAGTRAMVCWAQGFGSLAVRAPLP